MHFTPTHKETSEKKAVALSSVLAAVGLTGMKLVVGLMTGSLGILSEALHSGLDLIAALMTYFAVKFADRPPDKEHHYGHGKVENLSALFETFLLLITCVWIIYEAISRLSSGKVEIEVTYWSFIVVIISIIVDITRSRALNRVAKKYNSQALEADALHFSTDIFSSLVVLLGLVGAAFHYYSADSIAALCVAAIVLLISIRLGKRAVDVLLDRSPDHADDIVTEAIKSSEGVKFFHDVKIRTAGAMTFIDVTIHVQPGLTIEEAHTIAENVEEKIKEKIPNSQILIHQEPDIIPDKLGLNGLNMSKQ